jgi:hypothetical protein
MKFLKFDFSLFVLLVAGFILATIAGTILHECGHYIFARTLGFDARIHYASTSVFYPVNDVSLNERLWVTIGGPFQTMLTGTIGFLILYLKRKSFFKTEKLGFPQWAIVFVSLFWLRQVANFALAVAVFFITRGYPARGDELKISRYLQIPDITILAVTAFLGLLVSLAVIFGFIPAQQRFTFIISGLVGGIAGYLFWIEWIGKMVLP